MNRRARWWYCLKVFLAVRVALAILGFLAVAVTPARDLVPVPGWEDRPYTPGLHNVVVCSLCSCYPWSLLGLPPAWYKSPAYRSRVVREPRAVLAEMGLDLPPSVEIRVWDSSAEVRSLVLPERPPETEGLSEAELADLVSRDAMIGVALPVPRDARHG